MLFQHYTHALTYARTVPEHLRHFPVFAAGCLLLGGLAAAIHSRLLKVELCHYKPIIPLSFHLSQQFSMHTPVNVTQEEVAAVGT